MGATEFSWSALVMELLETDPMAPSSHIQWSAGGRPTTSVRSRTGTDAAMLGGARLGYASRELSVPRKEHRHA
jgi:hypothetical protein